MFSFSGPLLEPLPEPLLSPSEILEQEFEDFWGLYPRKVGRGSALRAYRAARKKAGAQTLADRLRQTIFSDETEFIPHPATWLNGERWLDESGGRPTEHTSLAERERAADEWRKQRDERREAQ